MFRVVELPRSRLRLWTSVLALTLAVAGCSAESTRFNENPYATQNPADATGSVRTVQTAPVGRIESQPLPPVAQAPAAGRPYPVAANPGVAGGARGMASYSPGAAPVASQPAVAGRQLGAPDVTGSVAPAAAHAPRPMGGSWTWDGGTAVTIAQGDTVDTVSRRYGVPPTALMHANNITAQAQLYPGQQLVIPRYVAAPAAAPPTPRVAAAPPPTRPAPVAAAPVATAVPPAPGQGVHVVAAGETLNKISRLYGKPVGEIAKANNIRPTQPLKIGERLVIPGVRSSAIKSKVGTDVAQAKAAVPAAAREAEPVQSISLASATTEPAKEISKATTEAAGALPTFRWPANGRVIASFGTSPNGVQNDGINLALPEGTSVKSAEDGVVAYAGNELKGYGNLVLVRHPNGYVTAYAHAKEIMVKRGDQVKRGQVIAKSGQTGNVNAPQLHFEIRKGASPLDPMRFLKGA